MEQTDTAQASPLRNRHALIVWAAVLLLAWLVWSRYAELDAFVQTLQAGRPLWIGLAFAVQLLFLTVYASMYRAAFVLVGVPLSLRRFIGLVFAFKFVNTTVTSAGAAGSAYIIERVRQQGTTRARAMAGMMLVITTDYAGFVVLLTVGVGMLVQLRDLTLLEGFTSLVMYAIVLGLGSLLSAGLWSPDGLRRWFESVQRHVNRLGRVFNRPNLLAPTWAAHSSADFIATAIAIRQQPKRLAQAIVISLTAHLLGVATLYLLFIAFNTTAPLTFVMTLYAMTTLFTIVTPTPGGVGVVETVMPAVYVSLGVPLEVGTIINLAYRGITFWLPVFAGFFALRRT